MNRKRVIGAPRGRVWDLVSDPHHLPRWWPRTVRVEDVRGSGKRGRWTTVLGTQRGRGVRVDYRCVGATNEESYAWVQEIEGSPFERIFKAAELRIRLEDRDSGTLVSLESSERLKGLSQLGSPMMRRATGRRLDEALSGIERALT